MFNFAQMSFAILPRIIDTGVQSFLPLPTTSGPGPRPGSSGRGLFRMLGMIKVAKLPIRRVTIRSQRLACSDSMFSLVGE
jgi:hypothetical protein